MSAACSDERSLKRVRPVRSACSCRSFPATWQDTRSCRGNSACRRDPSFGRVAPISAEAVEVEGDSIRDD